MDEYEFRGRALPAHMLQALRGYTERGEPVGGFLTAVLENNLSEAVGRADGTNMWLLPVYAAYLYNEAPAACWGSPATVKTWLLIHQGDAK